MATNETRRQNAREFRDIFDAATLLLKTHFEPRPGVPDSPNPLFITRLFEQAHKAHIMGLGYLAEYNYLRQEAGNDEQTQRNLGLSESSQVWALIFANAAKKANRCPDGTIFDRVLWQKLSGIQDRVLHAASNPRLLGQLQANLDRAESHGWTRTDGSSRLMIVNGAEWCPDTANVLRMTVAFQLPAHLIFMAEENKRKKGFRRYSDHALAVTEQDPDKPRSPIPVIAFPDGNFLVEPKPYEFIARLVESGIL